MSRGILVAENREVNEVGISCQMCGTENGDGLKFCSACGNALTGAGQGAAGPSSAASSGGKAKTMMMTPVPKAQAETRSVQPPAAEPDKKPEKVSKKTMLGIPAAITDGSKSIPMAKVSSAAPSPIAEKNVGRSKGSPAKTVLGMAAVTGPAPSSAPSAKPVQQTVSDKAPAAKPKGGGSRTVLGMPAMGFEASPEKAVKDTAPKPAAQPAPSEQSAPKPLPAGPTEALPIVDKPKEEAPRKKFKPAVESSLSYEDDDSEEEDERMGDPPKSKGLLIAVAFAGSIAVIAVFVVIYLSVFDKSQAMRPQIFPSADGKSVTVALPFPDAPPGATVQAVGQNVPINQGQARIDIPMTQIKLGTNNIALSYIKPGDSPEQMTFPIVLRHSVTDDFSGLVTENPFITIAFQVASEVRLTVEGKPAQIVGNAYFHKVYLKDIPNAYTADSDVVMVKVPFQLIDSTGALEQGEHVTAVPLTKLQINRPAPAASVVSDSVICSGTAEEGAQITVNGNPVGVTAAGFSTTVALDTMGKHRISVVARAPGKAPRKVDLTVTRIESLEPAIAEWSKDLDAELDYPTIGRDPNAEIDKKVKLNGRVVNISTERGVTAFILYVGEGCPARSKCAVYVVFRGETDAGLQSWVDVFGTVRGTRAVEMQNGVKINVPAVDAAFVVKTNDRTNASRGKRRKK